MSDIISKRIISSASAACSYMFQAGRERAKGDKNGEEAYTIGGKEAFDRMCADVELLKRCYYETTI